MNTLNLSPFLRLLSAQIYNKITLSPGITKEALAESFDVPPPLISLAVLPLIKVGLIKKSICHTSFYPTDKEFMPALLPTLIRQGEKRIPYSVYDAFLTQCTKEKLPQVKDFSKTTFKELTIDEYLKYKEIYDYGSTSIFFSNNSVNPYFLNEYFYRQLSKNLNSIVPELKTHIYLATNESQMIGFVCFSNYNSCCDIRHNLPCKNEEIFNVCYLATRKDCQGHGIASELLKRASRDLFKKERVFALNYLPINQTSEHIMRKTFNKSPFFIKERTYSPKDERIFGSLNQFIIFHENQQTLEYEYID